MRPYLRFRDECHDEELGMRGAVADRLRHSSPSPPVGFSTLLFVSRAMGRKKKTRGGAVSPALKMINLDPRGDGMYSGTFRWKKGKMQVSKDDENRRQRLGRILANKRAHTNSLRENLVDLAKRDPSFLDALSFPLTVLYIVKKFQKQILKRLPLSKGGKKILNIVVIGATVKAEERTLVDTAYWEEIPAILTECDLALYMVGPEVSRTREVFRKSTKVPRDCRDQKRESEADGKDKSKTAKRAEKHVRFSTVEIRKFKSGQYKSRIVSRSEKGRWFDINSSVSLIVTGSPSHALRKPVIKEVDQERATLFYMDTRRACLFPTIHFDVFSPKTKHRSILMEKPKSGKKTSGFSVVSLTKSTTGSFLRQRQREILPENTLIVGFNTGYGNFVESKDKRLLEEWMADLRYLSDKKFRCLFTCANDYADLVGEFKVQALVLGANFDMLPFPNPFESATHLSDPESTPQTPKWARANSFIRSSHHHPEKIVVTKTKNEGSAIDVELEDSLGRVYKDGNITKKTRADERPRAASLKEKSRATAKATGKKKTAGLQSKPLPAIEDTPFRLKIRKLMVIAQLRTAAKKDDLPAYYIYQRLLKMALREWGIGEEDNTTRTRA
eukprot:jgi/Bigna1/80257/fgenesh1_pg.69_\